MSPSAEAIPSELVGTWDIDPNHSTIEAVARYAMLSNVRGHFDTFSGTIAVGQTLSQSSVEVEIVAASVNTGVEMRDNHLRSADFMDVEHHPKITFRSTRVEPAGEDRYRVRGDFTLRGVTKGLELDVQFEGIGPDPWGNTRAGIFARTTINRKDFGANWNAILEPGGVLVGDSLKIELNVSASYISTCPGSSVMSSSLARLTPCGISTLGARSTRACTLQSVAPLGTYWAWVETYIDPNTGSRVTRFMGEHETISSNGVITYNWYCRLY